MIYDDPMINMWANMCKNSSFITESQMNEGYQLVDDTYEQQAIAAAKAAGFDKQNKAAYDQLLKYLAYNKGRQLAVDPQTLVDNRIKSAGATSASTNKPALSRDEYISQMGQQFHDRRAADAQAELDNASRQKIKSIWVKKVVINGMKGNADLEITYMDGRKENAPFDISTTGITGNYANTDQMYKLVKRNLQHALNKTHPGYKATEIEIRVAMIRSAFGDSRIQWFYGANKVTDAYVAYSPELKEVAKDLQKTMQLNIGKIRKPIVRHKVSTQIRK